MHFAAVNLRATNFEQNIFWHSSTKNNRHALTLLVAVTYTYACSQASVCESQASVCARFLGRGREWYTRLQPCVWARLISRNATYKMSHVTNVDESCHTYESVSSHMRMDVLLEPPALRHVTCTNRSREIYEKAMSHMWMSHARYMNESCHMYQLLIWRNTTLSVSCHVYAWVMSDICMGLITNVNQSYHIYESCLAITHFTQKASRLMYICIY